MKKHIRSIESIMRYDYDDDSDICELKVVIYSSAIRLANLENIQNNFRILFDFYDGRNPNG